MKCLRTSWPANKLLKLLGSSTRKETRVRVLSLLVLLAVNGELARRLTTSFKCLPTVEEMIFYLEIHLGLYFDCTSAMVLELNLNVGTKFCLKLLSQI